MSLLFMLNVLTVEGHACAGGHRAAQHAGSPSGVQHFPGGNTAGSELVPGIKETLLPSVRLRFQIELLMMF